MLVNLSIALGVVVAELVIMIIAGLVAYARLKHAKDQSYCDSSFTDIEREDLIALSEELGKTNRMMFNRLEKLDEMARINFSPGMGALRRGYQEALDSMKTGASSLMSEPPNLAMTCQALLESNQALTQAMDAAGHDLAGQAMPTEDESEETPDSETPTAEEDPSSSEEITSAGQAEEEILV